MKTGRLGEPAANGNGHRPAGRPKGRRIFSSVVHAIKKQGEPAGYRQMRDILFLRFDELAPSMGGAGVLKLAIEASKHALMVETNANKQSGSDAEKYDAFQAYLRGETQVPPSPTTAQGGLVTESARVTTPADDDETTGEDDAEEA